MKKEVAIALREKDQQLRNLCSEILRRKHEENWEGLEWADRARFRDSLAQFEIQLEAEGYHFDGFAIQGSRPEPSVAQLADEALSEALRSDVVPPRQDNSGTLIEGS